MFVKKTFIIIWGAQNLTGENLKVVWVEFLTLSYAVLFKSVIAWCNQVGPHLELKTQPRFYPVSLILPMY